MTTSIQTDALLAKFATLAYKDKSFLEISANLPQGWQLDQAKVEPPFAAFSFVNTTTNQVIISYRGTDGVSDAGADWAITTGTWHTQFAQGMQFAKGIQSQYGNNVLVTGHSLGGAISQVVSFAYGWSGATLDPGAGKAQVGTAGFTQTATDLGLDPAAMGTGKLTNYSVFGSAVSGLSGQHIGDVRYVPGLEFSGMDGLKSFALSLLNPLAGIGNAILTDQFSNKHNSEQVAQTVSLMAHAAANGTDAVFNGNVNMVPKTESYIDDKTGQEMTRYVTGEFVVQDANGAVLGNLKYTGATLETRQLEISSSDSSLLSIVYPTGSVSRPVYSGDSKVTIIAPLSDDGELKTDVTLTDANGKPVSRTHTDYFYDDNGEQSRIETTVTSSGTVRNTYDNEGNIFKSETVSTGANNISYAIGATASFLSMVKAIQTGQPLAIATTGVNTLLAFQNLSTHSQANFNLSGTSAALSAMTSDNTSLALHLIRTALPPAALFQALTKFLCDEQATAANDSTWRLAV